ncbi:hypothetical protein ETB97_010942 [Aspergillus alliaceus]|uniref:Transcription factor domain-containing protein n=1 Tax=Petromyces alliaceus TaxID=209559 RepID=A0A8H5ZT63_PETAA|nr:hypothetical protein ETB97_010942 [Aspergillus burnettii]
MSAFLNTGSREASEQRESAEDGFDESIPQYIGTSFAAWNTFPCVQKGWLSAEEALIFLNYFYQNLAPWSAVLTDFFSDPMNHDTLVREEPLLSVTLLMIASRYHSLPGSSGRVRANYIHQILWQHCQAILLDLLLGQGQGATPMMRAIGTIEALLLLVEWHPKPLLHWGVERGDSQVRTKEDEPIRGVQSPAIGGLQRNDVIEAALRSDRMSWMLLGCASTLAQEIGIYRLDQEKSHTVLLNGIGASHHALCNTSIERERLDRASLLLRIFKHQLASRLGTLQTVSPFTGCITPQVTAEYGPGQRLRIVTAWVDISQLERSATEYMMASKHRTNIHHAREDSVRTDIETVTHMELALAEWIKEYPEFNSCLSSALKSAIFMEYQYLRAYIYSMGLRVKFECFFSSRTQHIEPRAQQKYLEEPFQTFADGVATSTCTLFQVACHLGRTGALKYAPVRVFVRIATASVLLLKVLALPLLTVRTEDCLLALRNMARVLRSNAADSVHLCTRYADFIFIQVEAYRNQFGYKSSGFMDKDKSDSTL